MCGLRGLPSSIGAGEGHLAVERAASRLGRFGLTDTCLIRSLALATLLADRDEVQLHLGFRSTDSTEVVLSGHAWVTLGGRALPDDSATLVDGEPGEEVAVLIAKRPGATRNHRERT
ncbi:MAG: lasso peptide biosynthesis B2 protein, partial [Thermoanaerobaculia bacterium]